MSDHKTQAYNNAEDAVILLMQKLTCDLQFNAGHITQDEYDAQIAKLDAEIHKALGRPID